MLLTLKRTDFTDTSTIGELSIDGKFECYIIEDKEREIEGHPVSEWKVKGKTAIPWGRYKIEITMSPRFGIPLPLLVNVPGFDGVRIHPGNTADDTEGCLLPGTAKAKNAVLHSRDAFNALFKKIKDAIESGKDVEIDIV